MLTEPSSDLHVHTYLSPCGGKEATPLAMLKAAQEIGLQAIGFADHYGPEPIPSLPFYDRQDARILRALRADLADFPTGLTVLVGIEADYTVYSKRCLAADIFEQVDFIIVAASHFHLTGTPQPRSQKLRDIAEHMLAFARGALMLPGVSVLAHPFACSKFPATLEIIETLSEAELGGLAELARENRVALEINGGAISSPAYREGAERFYRLAKEVGARFTLGSDAHRALELTRLEEATAWARHLGLRAVDFLSPDELRAWHRAKVTELKERPEEPFVNVKDP